MDNESTKLDGEGKTINEKMRKSKNPKNEKIKKSKTSEMIKKRR
jgi:hypothetical protein